MSGSFRYAVNISLSVLLGFVIVEVLDLRYFAVTFESPEMVWVIAVGVWLFFTLYVLDWGE